MDIVLLRGKYQAVRLQRSQAEGKRTLLSPRYLRLDHRRLNVA